MEVNFFSFLFFLFFFFSKLEIQIGMENPCLTFVTPALLSGDKLDSYLFIYLFIIIFILIFTDLDPL